MTKPSANDPAEKLSELSSSNAYHSMFIPFQRLPIEIRLKIWRISCFTTTRNISTWGHNSNETVHGRVYEMFSYQWQTSVPAVLHTCKESRCEGLKHYTTWKSVAWMSPLISIPEEEPSDCYNLVEQTAIYVTWEVDRIVLFNPFVIMDIRLAANELSNKFKENDLKFLAVNVGHCGRAIRGDILYLLGAHIQEFVLFNKACKELDGFNRFPLSDDVFDGFSSHGETHMVTLPHHQYDLGTLSESARQRRSSTLKVRHCETGCPRRNWS